MAPEGFSGKACPIEESGNSAEKVQHRQHRKELKIDTRIRKCDVPKLALKIVAVGAGVVY